MDILTWVTDQASSLPEPLVWALGGLFAFMEAGLGLGFVFPGETIVLVLSAALEDPVGAVGMGLVVTLCASAGDHVGYLLGRRFGVGIRDRKVIQRLGVQNWDRAVGVLERRGAWAVFLTRLVPVVRTLMPAAAGVAQLRYPAFLAASLGGALTWAAVYVGCGVLLRGSLDAVQQVLGNAGWVLVAVAVVVGATVFLVRRRRRTPTAARTGTGTPAPRPRRTIEVLTALRLASASAIVGVVLVAPPTSVMRGVVFGAGAVLVGTVTTRLCIRPRSRGAVERVVDRSTTVGLVVALCVGHLLPVSLVLAIAVPDLLVGASALATRTRRVAVRTPRLDLVRDLLLVLAVVLVAGSPGLEIGPSGAGIGTFGVLALFTAIVLGGVVAGQYGRRLLTGWEARTAIGG